MTPMDPLSQNQISDMEAGKAGDQALVPSPTAAETLGKAIAALSRFHRLYPSHHPSISDATDRFMRLLDVFFHETDRVTLGFLGKDLIVLARVLYRIEGSIQGLNSLFLERGIEKVRFSSGVGRDEIARFFAALSEKGEEETREQGVWAVEQQAWSHIRLGRFGTDATVADLKTGGAPLDLDEAKVVKEFLSSCHELVSQVREKKVIEFRLAKEMIENVLSGVILEDHAIPVVAQIKQHDPYTYTHILNVSTHSLAMGRLLGLTPPQLRELGLAALLHDTGKLLIPNEILTKEGTLTDEEFDIIRRHPVYGAGHLTRIKEMSDVVPIVAFEHHIGVDGSGYPCVPKGYTPHLCSRITAIADVFDALRTNRAYSGEVAKEETLQRMSTMQLDPFLLNLFARISNLYPVDEIVRLDNGEVGVVHELNRKDAFRPKVRVLYDAESHKAQSRRVVNLGNFNERENRFVNSIASTLSREELEKLENRSAS